MNATIPMADDLAELIGSSAERVENRSLLLDKFVFHKKWPIAVDDRGQEVKWDEATRWSFMRIAEGASQLLNKEAQDKRRRAGGRNVEPQNRDRLNQEAQMAQTLAGVKWDSAEIQSLRAKHTRRFIGLFRSAYGERASITVGQLEGRLAINLADSLIQNAGICLDHLFGLPYIPGSAVKGVCRNTALAELKITPEPERAALLEAFCAIFGTAENDFSKGDLKAFRIAKPSTDHDRKGAISFLPAYPLNEARIVVDLTNVHYPDYYRTGRAEDQSRENPRPNPFPAVEIGTQFAFCLVLNGMSVDTMLLATAARWLRTALTEHGLGAKTAAGYGWFSIQSDTLEAIEAEDRRDAEAAAAKAAAARKEADDREREARRKAELNPEALASEEILKLDDEKFAAMGKDLAAKEEVQQRAFIALLRDHREKRERWKTWKKRKPEITKSISDLCEKLNLPTLP